MNHPEHSPSSPDITLEELREFVTLLMTRGEITRQMVEEKFGTATTILPAGSKCSLGYPSGEGSWEVVNELKVDITHIRRDENGNFIVVGRMHDIRLVDSAIGSSSFNGSNLVSFTLKMPETQLTTTNLGISSLMDLITLTTPEEIAAKMREAQAIGMRAINVTGADEELTANVATANGWKIERVENAGVMQTFLRLPDEDKEGLDSTELSEYPQQIVLQVGESAYGFKNVGRKAIPGYWNKQTPTLELPNGTSIFWSDSVTDAGFDFPHQKIFWAMDVASDGTITITQR